MQEYLRKAHAEIDDRGQEHNRKHHHRQEFPTAREIEEVVNKAVVEQDKAAIVEKIS